MGSKGSKNCCCGPCDIRSGCFLGGFIPDHCCSCVPKHACISAIDANGYTIDSQFVEFQCPSYSATLDCNNLPIDVQIEWRKDEAAGTCEICLQSAILGHTRGTEDLRLCIPMEAYDKTKKQGCSIPDYTWEIDPPEGCDVAEIRFHTSALIAAPLEPEPLDDEHCIVYDRVCITVNDGIDTITERVCLDENNRWIYEGHGEDKGLGIELHNLDDPATLHLLPSTWLNITEPLVAVPDCPRMQYTWRGTRTEDDVEYPWSVSILGDRLNVCQDCTCYCECLCVTFTPSDGDPTQVRVCQNIYGWWDLVYGSFVGRLDLECVGCLTKVTMLGLTSDTHNVLGTGQAGIICPDRLIGDYSVELDEETTLAINVQCELCEDCPPIGIDTPCCDEPIPPVLYATLSGEGCGNLDGAVVRLEVDVAEACWSGTEIVPYPNTIPPECEVQLSLSCASGGQWTLVNGTTQCGLTGATAVSTPCRPLNLSFTLGPDGCCEEGINSEMTVVITE